MRITPGSSITCLIPRKESFAAHILTLMTGTGLAQGLTIAATPILSRIYSPESYGVLAIFLSVSIIFGSVASWRYEQAIVLPKDEVSAVNLLGISMILIGAMAILSLIVLLFWSSASGGLYRYLPFKRFLWLLPLSIFLLGTTQSLTYWNNRQKQFRRVAISNICQTGGSISSQIGAGLLIAPGIGGLIGGSLTGQVIGVSILGLQVRKFREMAKNLSIGRMISLARQYKDFARYTPFTDFLNVISFNAIPLVLSYFYSTAFLGLFMISRRLVSLPSQLIINSTWQTTYSDLNRLTFQEQRHRLRQIHQYIAYVFAFPSILLFFFPERIEAILGAKWLGIGELIIPLAFMTYMNAVSNSVSYFTVFDRYGEQALVNGCLVTLRLGVIILGGIYLNPLWTIYIFAGISSAIYAVINFRWAFYFSDTKKYISNIVGSILASFAFLVPASWLLRSVSLGIFIPVIMVWSLAYYLIILRFLATRKKLLQPANTTVA